MAKTKKAADAPPVDEGDGEPVAGAVLLGWEFALDHSPTLVIAKDDKVRSEADAWAAYKRRCNIIATQNTPKVTEVYGDADEAGEP